MAVERRWVGVLLGLVLCLGPQTFHLSFGSPEAQRYRFHFGPEFTFSNLVLLKSFEEAGSGAVRYVLQTEASQEILSRFKERFVGDVAPSWRSVEANAERRRILFQDHQGFGISAFSDPGVIEVTHSGITLADAQKRAADLQVKIFDTLQSVGVEPMAYAGAGHIHMDVRGFRGNLRLFRDFVVDFHNHAGLSMGGLNHDYRNSAALAELPDWQKQRFREVIAAVDSNRIQTIEDMIFALIEDVFRDVGWDDKIGRSRSRKFYAMSLDPSFRKFGTLELRCIRPQASYEVFVHQIRLFERRIQFLADRAESGQPPLSIGLLEPVNAMTALGQFERYVVEAGLDFKDYQNMVLDWWQTPGGVLEDYLSRDVAARMAPPTGAVPPSVLPSAPSASSMSVVLGMVEGPDEITQPRPGWCARVATGLRALIDHVRR